MILLTDDFSAIVDGIEEGRLIFDNLKKSIAYTLSSNIPEISPFLMFIIVQMPLSLTTVLILCVDLGTDMIPAISLAYEKPEADIMERPPRNAESDRLVTDRLMCFAYLQIGVFQALAGFYSFFVVLNDYGFAASTIPGNAMAFFPYPGATKDGTRYILGKSEASSTQGTDEISPCPCGGGQPFALAAKPLHKSAKPADMATESAWSVIKNGALPTVNDASGTPVASINGACALGLGITWDENWPYGYGCPYGSVKPTRQCKFSVDTDKLPGTDTPPPCYKASEALGHAQVSSIPGRPGQGAPRDPLPASRNVVDNATHALTHKFTSTPSPQTAAFVSIVIVQWADLLICKTRSLSIYHQGMKNPVLLFGMFSETCLCLLLAYAPGVDQGLGTRPLMFIHWCPSMPYSVCIFLYDELRKFLLRRDRRNHPGKIGFVERFSYY